MNETFQSQPNVRWLSYGSILLAILGAACYWWVPMGLVFGLAGLMLGLVDGSMARWRSLDYRLAMVGAVLAVAALILDGTIAYLGLQTWTFGSLI